MTKGKLIKLTLCGVVVGGLLLLGWQRWQYSNAYVSTDNAELDGVIIPVRAKLSGVVMSVPVTDNVTVQSGDLLFQIRDSEYQYQVEQREAQWQALLAAAGRGGGPVRWTARSSARSRCARRRKRRWHNPAPIWSRRATITGAPAAWAPKVC